MKSELRFSPITQRQYMTSRRYCFTINNPRDQDSGLLLTLDSTRYIVFQLEEGDGGTEHYQGWVVWRVPIRIPQCRQRLGGRAHVEIQRGSDDQAYEYATKQPTRLDGPWESGVRPRGPGTRSDLNNIQQLLADGVGLRTVAEDYFGSYVRYSTGIARARMLLAPRRRDPPRVDVFWGPTGTGKTRRAMAESVDPYVVTPPTGNGHVCWWDGYDLHSEVIIDEFYGWLPWSLLLRLLDRYPVRVRTQGGTVEFTAKRIWITSNVDPREWYRESRFISFGTLRRRISEITHFSEGLRQNDDTA